MYRGMVEICVHIGMCAFSVCFPPSRGGMTDFDPQKCVNNKTSMLSNHSITVRFCKMYNVQHAFETDASWSPVRIE